VKSDKTQRAKDRRAIERAMLRALRTEWLGSSNQVPGRLSEEAQSVLYGLEKARRQAGGKR
jgi:hypothetical protein